MQNSSNQNPRTQYIQFIIPGIRVDESISIPVKSRGLISRCASISRILVRNSGAFDIGQIPQFDHNVMRVPIERSGDSETDFDTASFESFVMDIKEFMESTPSMADGTNGPDNTKHKEKIAAVVKLLAGTGAITFRFCDARTVTLKFRASTGSKAEDHAIRTVESSTKMVMIKHGHGTIVMSAEDARKIRIGDRIIIDERRNARQVRRSIGKLRIKKDQRESQGYDLFNHEGATIPDQSAV